MIRTGCGTSRNTIVAVPERGDFFTSVVDAELVKPFEKFVQNCDQLRGSFLGRHPCEAHYVREKNTYILEIVQMERGIAAIDEEQLAINSLVCPNSLVKLAAVIPFHI